MSSPWSLQRGATIASPNETRFSVWAPNSEHVTVRIDGAEHAMRGTGGGVFECAVNGAGAGALYSYSLDGGPDRPDPVSRSQPNGVHGPSQIVDPRAFPWHDDEWRGVAMADLVIYELHVGTFSDAGTFAGIIPHLLELAELGITAIEVMPVAEFPGARNWGYDGVDLYAPHSAYGGPDALRRLVDAAHRVGLAVILDVVYNHLGPEGNYLGEFGPYFGDAYKTPWGRPLNFDGPNSDEVRRFFIDNALYWISEFHIDALRLDAVHAIYDFSARHVLDEIACEVHAYGAMAGRRTLVIAESDLNDPRLVRDGDRGGFALDAQWSDDFHHAVHTVLTGETRGYYEDFGGTGRIAKAIRDRFVYDGAYSAHRRRRHGAPASDVPANRFVVAMQNHDQIGNRAAGDRFSTLVPREKLRLAASLLLLSPYVPLLFMGEEYGETNPFLYFASHGDAALVEAVRAGRRAEFASSGWSNEVPDPQSEESFRRSRLSRAVRPEIAALYRDLLRLRKTEPALRPGDARVAVIDDDIEGWISTRLTPTAGGAPLLMIFNLSDTSRMVRLPDAVPSDWHELLSTGDARYGGNRVARDSATSPSFAIGPWSATLYRGAAE
ncbi:MAG: malto-oligosyltrehalose trehalohydrolase [Gemmatimonadota bacterium]|nr:malto-oligosyltrehalose trehalohydrolase [Gemmatimonadota bacterium]